MLKSSDLDPWKATDIENIFGGKTTDFIVPCSDKTVFVEAKSVRLGNIAVAHPVSGNIPNDLKDNVIKALQQGFDLAKAFSEKCINQNVHLIVVTYDDLHLGSPDQAWESFFKDYFTNKDQGYDVTKYISPSQIFIVGIRELEQICNHCKNADMLSNLLERAVTANKQPQTTKFSLTQSIPTDRPNDKNPLIKNNFDLFVSRISANLPQ